SFGALGNPLNFNLPLINCTSAFGAYSCHHRVSVTEGTRHTTVQPFKLSLYAFSTHLPEQEYGGFIQTTPCQGWVRPSCSLEKKAAHFAFSAVAQASSVNLKTLLSWLKNSAGVEYSSTIHLSSPQSAPHNSCTWLRTSGNYLCHRK